MQESFFQVRAAALKSKKKRKKRNIFRKFLKIYSLDDMIFLIKIKRCFVIRNSAAYVRLNQFGKKK
jgi:hypothetical protein